jgi:hypothetical protein
MIWIIDFLDFIFAEENLENGLQTITMILIYNRIHKMDFTHNIHSKQLLNPSLDLGFITIQVHGYRQ